MSQWRVVVTDQVFPDTDVEREILGEAGAELSVASGDRESVLQAADDADALLNTYLPLDREALSGLRRCKIVARYGIGVDNIDLDAAREAGIVVTNVPDYCVEEVAAHTVAMALALLRRLPQGDAKVRAGGWGIDGLRPVRRLSTLTAGLVGYGRISRRVAASFRELGMSLAVHDPYVSTAAEGTRLVKLDELLEISDVVSLHAPLTAGTRGLIGAPQLERMRDTAVLVNTSRGPLVVVDDVLDALRNGAIAGAALDVLDPEPPPPGLVDGVPNLLVTPHLAYYSEESLRESQRKAATQIVKVLSGQPPDYAVT